jgi:hypothetical protein
MFQLSRLMIGHLVIFTVLNCHVSNPIINLLKEWSMMDWDYDISLVEFYINLNTLKERVTNLTYLSNEKWYTYIVTYLIYLLYIFIQLSFKSIIEYVRSNVGSINLKIDLKLNYLNYLIKITRLHCTNLHGFIHILLEFKVFLWIWGEMGIL